MKFDRDMRPGAPGLREADGAYRDSGLAGYAELFRRQLDCGAVVIRIADPFAELFAADGSATARSTAPVLAPLGAPICAVARDPETPLPRPARGDPALLANPVTAGEMGFAFYAGLPLHLASGEPLGMLAALDRAPRDAAGNELATSRMMAATLVEIAELRLALSARRGPWQRLRGA